MKNINIVMLIVAFNILFFLYKDIFYYGYFYYKNDYKENKKAVTLSDNNGNIRTFELNDYFVVVAGEPSEKYIVFGSLFIYKDGFIRIDDTTLDKNVLIKKLHSEDYIKDIYADEICSVHRFIKPFKEVGYDYAAFIEGVQAVFSFNASNEEGNGISEICNIFKTRNS